MYRYIKWPCVVATLGLVIFACFMLPRNSALPEGYSYTYFPSSGHRYVIAPGGIKKAGQEVLSYEVKGTVITGTVRRTIGSDNIQSFRLDLKSGKLTMGDLVQGDEN